MQFEDWQEIDDDNEDWLPLMPMGSVEIEEQVTLEKSVEIDDPSMPTLTFRFWVISSFLTAIIAATAQFFFFRLVGLSLSPYIVQMISFPLGKLMDKLPSHPYFNPSPFNKKEHALIVIAATTATSAAYAVDILTVQRIYFDQNIGPLSSIILLWTTQCIGYGLSGFLKSTLVSPPSMVWPIVLPIVEVFNTLHSSKSIINQQKSKLFFSVAVGIFFYQFIPVFAPILTWISPLCIFFGSSLSTLLSTMASGRANGGFLNISLDWSAVGGNYPLYLPLWAQINQHASASIFNFIVIPILYFFNYNGSQHYPLYGFLTRVPFPNGTAGNNSVLGLPNISPINYLNVTLQQTKDGIPLLPKFNSSFVLFSNLTLNTAVYDKYGPMMLSPWWAFGYGTLFGTLTASLSYTYFFHGKSLMETFRRVYSGTESSDEHSKMMKAYEEVPYTWYCAIFVTMILLSIINVEFLGDLQIRWWGIILAVIVACLFALPIGVIQAVTGTGIGINVLTEMIMGYLRPGEPIANVMFKTYGYMAMNQALDLVSDQKLGLYMKIPPRSVFIAQFFGTCVGALTNYLVMEIILSNVNFKDPNGDPQWSARATATFYTASLIWGVVGPSRLFGGYYKYQLLWFVVGAILPYFVYRLHKKYERNGESIWKYVNIPIILHASTSNIRGAHTWLTAISIAIFFHYYIKKTYPNWYNRKLYVFGAALDLGTSLSVVSGFVLMKMNNFLVPSSFMNPPDTADYCRNAIRD